MTRLDGRVAVIAGGGSGMGAAIARRFAAAGAFVWIGDVDASAADAVAAEIRDEGEQAETAVVDVTDMDSVTSMAALVVARHGRVDILVNCAGIAEFMPFEASTAEHWERVVGVCLTGTAWACRTFGSEMVRQGRGSIINIASTGGLFGVPGMAAYTAAKHGVVGLTRALAAEWGRHGVRVNCICPGATLTPMLLATTEAYRSERIRRVPLGRLADPDDQARVALFLASDDSAYLTGAIITVDGGVAAVAPGTSDSAISG